MADDQRSSPKTSNSIQTHHNSRDTCRRTFLRQLGAGVSVTALVGSSATAIGSAQSVEIERVFDPIWYSPNDDYWYGITKTETDGTNRYGGLLLRRNLTLNEVRTGDYDNMFSFNLHTLGVSAGEDIPESNLPDGIGPIQTMHSNHTMEIESDDVDVRDITTNYPRISATRADNGAILTEIPEREDEWTTSKQDLEQADVNLPDGEASLLLGGASIATGLAAGVPTLGIGTAAFLTGTSVVLGVGGLVASMDDEGTTETQTKDKWKYNLKETTGGVLNNRKDIAVFSHNLIIDVPVDHGQSAHIDIYDKIQANQDALAVPYQDEATWVDNHKTGYWQVYIPSYSASDDPEQNPPEPMFNPQKTL